MILDKIKKRERKDEEEKEGIIKPDIPIGKWVKCNKCGEILYKDIVHENYSVCPNCGYHFRLSSRRRIKQIADEGSFVEYKWNLSTANPLHLEGYEEKIKSLQEKTKIEEAVLCGECTIEGQKAVVGIMDGNFLMGSMGVVVGEKITRLIEKATKQKLPLILFSVSGGARMQEGIQSLMQMAKTSAAIAKYHEKGLLYISVLTDPTYGGVTASFASLGDIILAEPEAMIGFAGKRVIAGTIHEELPEDFQTAEFLLEHGFIDKIVPRKEMKSTLAFFLKAYQKEEPIEVTTKGKKSKKSETKKQTLSAWERVEIARKPGRATSLDYIAEITEEFVELHGDRYFADDKATVCGIGKIKGKYYMILAQQKGRTTKENMERNFGMPNPESYRKALRLMKQAEKFGKPILTLIDTKGAYPGTGAEERGQGEAIAKNLMEMVQLTVPILAIVIGEGSSGGALALGVADRVAMLENAVYSILSPEGYASILWKDSSRVKEAAEKMKLTAEELWQSGIVDAVLPEPEGGVKKENIKQVSEEMVQYIVEEMSRLEKLSKAKLTQMRYEKFRNMGEYKEEKNDIRK